MIWDKLVTIFGTFFLVCACISVVIYLIEKINYNRILGKRDAAETGRKKLAIITGASSGLGRDYARFFCEHKKDDVDQLLVIARREERLEELKDSLTIPTTVYPMDMTNEEEMAAFKIYLEEKVQSERIDIAYLINAAGLGFSGYSLELGSEKEVHTGKINCEAQVRMVHIVAPLMGAGGNIIQIASVAAFNPIPNLNVYAASKAFIYTYARGLRGELLPKGINVTTVCPYFIEDTEFIDKAEMDRKKLFLPLKSQHVVEKSMKDTDRGFAVSTPGVIGTLDRIFCGLIPDEVLLYLMKLFA
ncbi:MAG: SDR family NAD(P)-dependent oxidoreductase [Firmicutes bacterium]|nr:SDR family NAD(P)-dependent oxidoreductase [Bacillota bacterium]